MDTLIIAASLVNPPTESLAFYFLTMTTKSQMKFSNLLEVEKEFKDIYYHFIKDKRIHDYISEIITPEEDQMGIRLDLDYNFPLTVKTDRICFTNVQNILGQLNNLKDIRKI